MNHRLDWRRTKLFLVKKLERRNQMPDTTLPNPRPELSAADVDAVFDSLQEALYQKLGSMDQRGYAGKHEILGVLEHEFFQLKKAMNEEHFGLNPVKNELLDIAVAAILGVACIRGGVVKS
jgi:hypothetical protein